MATKTKALLPGPAAPVLLDVQQRVVRFKLPAGKTLARLETLTASMDYAPLLQQYPDTTVVNGVVSVPLNGTEGALNVRVTATSTTAPGQASNFAVDKAVVVTKPRQASTSLFIFNGPVAEVMPGDIIEVQGSPSENCQGVLKVPGQPPAALKAVAKGPTTRAYRLPPGTALAEYEFYLIDATGYSNSIFLNRPAVWSMLSGYVLGGYPIELHGPSLGFAGFTTSVRLVTADGDSYPATLVPASSGQYVATATVQLPDKFAGEELDVYVSNGLPGGTEVKAKRSVTAVTRTADPLGIGQAYAHRINQTVVEYAINAENSTAGLRAACDQLAALGPLGGLIHIKPGTAGSIAHLTTGFVDPSSTCLQPDCPIIFYATDPSVEIKMGLPGDFVGTYPELVHWNKRANCGFANIKVTNVNAAGAFWRVMGFEQGADNFIWHNVTADFSGTEGMKFVHYNDAITFKEVHITGGSIKNAFNGVYLQPFGPMQVRNFDYFSVKNCQTSHAIGQNSFLDGTNLTVSGCDLNRDATNYAAIVAASPDNTDRWQARHISTDGVRGFYLWNNRVTTTGIAGTDTDGEVYLIGEDWGGGVHRANGYSAVAGCNGNKLRVASLAFFTQLDRYGVGSALSIVAGPGTGQVATITAINNTVFTLDKPFLVPPTAASTVAIGSYCVTEGIMGGGTASDCRGPLVNLAYRCYGENLIVADINATRCEGMQLENGQVISGNFYGLTVARGVSFRRNKLDNGNQTVTSSRLHLVQMVDGPNLTTAQGGGPLRGTVVYGLDITDNTIIPNSNASLTFPVIAGGQNSAQIGKEGFAIAVKNNNGFPVPTTLPTRPTEGVVLQRNKGPLLWNEGATYPVLSGNTFSSITTVAVEQQQGPQAVQTLTGAEVLTEAIVNAL